MSDRTICGTCGSQYDKQGRCECHATGRALDKDTVIRLAREAGFDVEAVEGTDEVLERESDYYTRHPDIGYMVQTHTVERFAALVEQHLTYDSIHSCHPNCDKPACVAIRAAVLAEREECAKVCDEVGGRDTDSHAWDAAAAIRSRT